MDDNHINTLDILSAAAGIRIQRFVRIRSQVKRHRYQLTVEDQVLEIPSIAGVDSQPKLRRLILSHTNARMLTMKKPAWHDFLKRLFSIIENVSFIEKFPKEPSA